MRDYNFLRLISNKIVELLPSILHLKFLGKNRFSDCVQNCLLHGPHKNWHTSPPSIAKAPTVIEELKTASSSRWTLYQRLAPRSSKLHPFFSRTTMNCASCLACSTHKAPNSGLQMREFQLLHTIPDLNKAGTERKDRICSTSAQGSLLHNSTAKPLIVPLQGNVRAIVNLGPATYVRSLCFRAIVSGLRRQHRCNLNLNGSSRLRGHG